MGKLRALEHPDFDLETNVVELLNELGVPFSFLGREYLRTAIIKAVVEPDILISMINVLYPYVAKVHNTTCYAAEKTTIAAVKATFDRGNADALRELFGDVKKIGTSEFIGKSAERIWLARKRMGIPMLWELEQLQSEMVRRVDELGLLLKDGERKEEVNRMIVEGALERLIRSLAPRDGVTREEVSRKYFEGM